MLGGGEHELSVRADAFALDGEQRGGLLPRRLNHQPRGVSGFVGLFLGNQIDAIVVVALPRGVAGADRVKRHARRRLGFSVLRHRADRKGAAFGQRDRQGHWIGGGRHREVSLLGFGALGLPAVEAAAFRTPHAVPLHFDQGQIDLDAGDRSPVRSRRHDGRADPVALIDEQRRPFQPDVPGRGMHDEAGAAGDVLAGQIFDVALDCVFVRQAVARLGVEIQRQHALGIERGGLRSELARFRTHARVTAADKREAIGGKSIQDTGGRLQERRARIRPGHRTIRHRRAEQVATVDRGLERRPGQRHCGVAAQGGVDAEFRAAVGGHEKRAAHRPLPLLVRHLVFVL